MGAQDAGTRCAAVTRVALIKCSDCLTQLLPLCTRHVAMRRPHLGLAAILALLSLSALASVGAQFSTRVTTGQLFQYTFEEGQLSDTANATVDTLGISSLGNIQLNTAACSLLSDRPGLLLPGSATQQPGFSKNTQATMLATIETSRVWTMEAWFTPANLDQASMIFAFGGWSNAVPTESPSCWAAPLTFDFHQAGANVGANQAQGTALSKACSLEEDFLDSPTLTHLTLTYTTNGTAFVYLNGQYNGAHYSRLRTYFPYWDPSHRLSLTPDLDFSGGGFTWKGSLFLISMYNRVLSAAEITTNYAAGLPNAKPQPVSRLIGLVGFQDTTTRYNVTLDATDVDGVDGKALYIMLVSFPTLGTLRVKAAAGWINLPSSSTAWLIDTPRTDPVQFEYTPPTGVNGLALAQIGYAGRDATSIGRVGYVVLDILPVPTPRNVTTISKLGIPISVGLQASNIASTTVVFASVTSLPTVGSLFQTADGITPLGSALKATDLPVLVTYSTGAVIFVTADSDIPSASISGQQCYGSTSFKFSVRMASGPGSSQEGIVSLQVCSRLNATSSNITLAAASQQMQVNLLGASALSTEAIRLVLLSLPAHGRLIHTGTDPLADQRSLAVGDVIDIGPSNGTGVLTYRRAQDLPSQSDADLPTDSFTFATQLPSNPLMMSPTATVSVTLPLLAALQTWTTRLATTKADSTTQAIYTFQDYLDGTDQSASMTMQDRSTNGGGGTLISSTTSYSVGVLGWMNYSAGVAFAASNASSSTPGLVSSSTVDALRVAFQISGSYTVEMWLSFDAGRTGLIFSLGVGGGTSSALIDVCATYELWVWQSTSPDLLYICQRCTCSLVSGGIPSIVGSAPTTPVPGSLSPLANATAAQLAQYESVNTTKELAYTRVHLTIVHGSTFNIYVHGALVQANSAPAITLTADPWKIALGAYGWIGRMHFLALMSRALTASEIALNYAAGPPPARPTAIPKQQEDLLNEFAGGSLPATFISSTEVTAATVGSTFITALPSQGSLVVAAASSALPARAILASELPFAFSRSLVSFSYVAPTGQFSGSHVASFQWTTCVGMTCSRPAVSGTVWISINRVVQVPLSATTSIKVMELTPTKLVLAGTDVDQHPPINSPIVAFWIDALPTGGKVFLAGPTEIVPDLTRLLLASMLPLRTNPLVTAVWFIATSGVTATVAAGSSIDGGSLSFRAEVKSTVAPFNLTAATTGNVRISITRHLYSQTGAVVFPFSATRVQLPLVAGVEAGSGANSFLSSVLDSVVLGDTFASTVGSASTTVLTASEGCILLLDDALAFPSTGGVAHGLDITWLGSNTGTTLYLQQWVISGASGKMVSSSALTVSGSAGARRWELASSEWWDLAAADATYTRVALCVANGAMPLRTVLNGTATLTTPFRVMATMPFVSVVGTIAPVPLVGTTQRKLMAVDVRLLIWPRVRVANLAIPSTWPSVDTVLSTSDQLQLVQPTLIWEQPFLLLTKRPLYGIIIDRSVSSSSATELCASPAVLPCLLTTQVDYYRSAASVAGLSQAQRLRADTVGYETGSVLTTGGIAVVLGPNLSQDDMLTFSSTSSLFTVTTLSPPLAPSFKQVLQTLPATPVKVTSSDSFPFSLALSPGNTTSNITLSYRVSMSVFPSTGGFSFPLALGSDIASKVTFTSGTATGNIVSVFVTTDLATLNTIFSDVTFQPLYVNVYNISIAVTSRMGSDSESVDSARANVLFTVTASADTSSSSSSSGTFSFLTGKNMIYVWCALGGLGALCIFCVFLRRYRAYRKVQNKKEERAERRADRAARRAEGISDEGSAKLDAALERLRKMEQSTPPRTPRSTSPQRTPNSRTPQYTTASGSGSASNTHTPSRARDSRLRLQRPHTQVTAMPGGHLYDECGDVEMAALNSFHQSMPVWPTPPRQVEGLPCRPDQFRRSLMHIYPPSADGSPTPASLSQSLPVHLALQPREPFPDALRMVSRERNPNRALHINFGHRMENPGVLAPAPPVTAMSMLRGFSAEEMDNPMIRALQVAALAYQRSQPPPAPRPRTEWDYDTEDEGGYSQEGEEMDDFELDVHDDEPEHYYEDPPPPPPPEEDEEDHLPAPGMVWSPASSIPPPPPYPHPDDIDDQYASEGEFYSEGYDGEYGTDDEVAAWAHS